MQSQLPSHLFIGFTGRRDLSNPAQVANLITHAIDEIAAIHPLIAGISSAAYGGDTLFAQECLRRAYPLTVILPFACDRFAEDFTDSHSKDWPVSLDIIRQATHVELVYPALSDQEAALRCNSKNAQNAANERPPRVDQQSPSDPYMDAGYRTVDLADVVIAVWNELPGKGWGGTADTVGYAKAISKPLIIINPETGNITYEQFEQFTTKYKSDATGPRTFDALNHDYRGQLTAFFESCNAEAKKHGPLSRRLVRFSLWLFLLASSIGYAGLVFQLIGRLGLASSAASFALVIAGTTLMIIHSRRHGRWLICRVEAEVARSFLATWDIRKHQPHRHEPRPALPGMQDLFKTLRFLRMLDLHRSSDSCSFEKTRSTYEEVRLDHQILYFTKHMHIAKKDLTRRRALIRSLGLLTVLCSLTVFILSIFAPRRLETTDKFLHFFAETLPLAVTALGISLMTRESTRRAVRYQEMLDDLVPLQRRLKASNTWDSLARVATDVEEVLLQEVLEWRSYVRFTRDIAHPE